MATNDQNPVEEKKSLSFVEQIVEKDLAEGKNGQMFLSGSVFFAAPYLMPGRGDAAL